LEKAVPGLFNYEPPWFRQPCRGGWLRAESGMLIELGARIDSDNRSQR
jgi:hypothetical protein